jgi:hypothetical protein
VTPAEELRAAATRLRYCVKALVDEAKPPQQPLMWFAEDLIIGATLTGGDADPMDHKLTRAEAAWLALITPKLAEPLAMLLEDQAAMYEHYLLRGADVAERIVWRGLGAARVINGGAS